MMDCLKYSNEVFVCYIYALPFHLLNTVIPFSANYTSCYIIAALQLDTFFINIFHTKSTDYKIEEKKGRAVAAH